MGCHLLHVLLEDGHDVYCAGRTTRLRSLSG
ncbi:MAG: hypothetical protein ACLFM1_04320 [Bacteroidales bacterium]